MDTTPTWAWLVFGGLLAALLGLDLFLHRGHRESSRRAAIAWSVVWVVAGLAFALFVHAVAGTERAIEYVAAYAVTYVIADEEMNVTLAMSSNDQGKGWLNGTLIYTMTEARTLDKDTDVAEVTLKKGQNVLAMKVINEINNWQGCARFLKDGQPVTNLKISLTPQP